MLNCQLKDLTRLKWAYISMALFGMLVCASTSLFAQCTVTTFAGDGTFGYRDGSASDAQFAWPTGIVVASDGCVYVADSENNCIRKITPEGVVSTFAGNGQVGYVNGVGTSARFNGPENLTIDSEGNIYVSDLGNCRIRKITKEGIVSNYAGSGTIGATDGAADSASFFNPSGLAFDNQGNLYVADAGNNRIRRISPNGIVTTVAGNGDAATIDGQGVSASFSIPSAIAFAPSGVLFVSEMAGASIRQVSQDGRVTTVAGLGTGTEFGAIFGIIIHPNGNLYIAERGRINDVDKFNRIRKVAPNGEVTTLAGIGTLGQTNGPCATASFSGPRGIAIDRDGNLLVADGAFVGTDLVGHCIRKITLK